MMLTNWHLHPSLPPPPPPPSSLELFWLLYPIMAVIFKHAFQSLVNTHFFGTHSQSHTKPLFKTTFGHIDRVPSVSKSNEWHVDIFSVCLGKIGVCSINSSKMTGNLLESWILTRYVSNSTGSFVTGGEFLSVHYYISVQYRCSIKQVRDIYLMYAVRQWGEGFADIGPRERTQNFP